MNQLTKLVLTVVGSIFIAIGVIGIFLPLLPTTPFLLLGAACYVKGSQRLYSWLISNKWLGSYIKNYREGRGMPLKTKAITISLLWITIGYSVIFIISKLHVRALLLFVAIGVTWHISSLKTLERSSDKVL